MKFRTHAGFALASLILTVMVSCSSSGSKAAEETPSPKSTIDVIHERTSIRRYTEQKLTSEQLETLVRAGMAAPSATNAQPWMFIVVDDPDLLRSMGEALNTSRMVISAPSAILVCGDLQKAREGWIQEYWIQDCSAASENILLAATSMGLGAVWTSVFPAQDRIKTVSEILGLPSHIIPLNIIPVGYSDEDKEPQDKWKPENVKWNRWE